MSRLVSLLDLDPATYAAHPIHSDERTYSETNCYVDCLVELLHAVWFEPEAMMGGAVAADLPASPVDVLQADARTTCSGSTASTCTRCSPTAASRR